MAIEFTKGTILDKEDIIDFENYVFSHHQGHTDFIDIMPKIYSKDRKELSAEHYLVKQDGRIKALVANNIIEMSICGQRLKVGGIGSVSVHPYSRGEGFMKVLMQQAIAEAKEKGVDILLLGGIRQRYAYFGFENGGVNARFSLKKKNIEHGLAKVDASNVRFEELTKDKTEWISFANNLYSKRLVHALRSQEDFFDIVCSWDKKCMMVFIDNELVGYVVGALNEVVLTKEEYYPKVLKAMFEQQNYNDIEIVVACFELERMEFLASICQDYVLGHTEMLSVLSWENVIKTSLILKSKTIRLEDGEVCVGIEDKQYRITVKDNVPNVEEVKNAKVVDSFTHNEAERRFFEIGGFLIKKNEYKNWLLWML